MFSIFKKNAGTPVKAPASGQIKDIETVSDPVFSEKMMGDGIAIQYEGGDIKAPVSGTLTTIILPSCHAFGICGDNGIEILVHVGLETVNLKGEGFKLLKKQGDHVEQGESILSVDYELLKSKGLNLITPVVVTNSNEFEIIKKSKGQCITGDTVLFEVKKK